MATKKTGTKKKTTRKKTPAKRGTRSRQGGGGAADANAKARAEAIKVADANIARIDGKAKRSTGGKKKTSKSASKSKRTGILDAAAQILAKAKEPMKCKTIVEQALEQKLWTTSGKTPHATLYAAIIREIATRGDDARFEKVDRGRFQLRAAPGTKGS